MRFIWGHVIVHLLALDNASSEGLHIYIVLVSATLIGVSRQVGFSSRKFTPALWHCWDLPNDFFKQGAKSNTLDICFLWLLVCI